MSQQIENQIVKMQFDNASFEKNASQSMSTLDKLKAALKFDKVDMSHLQNSLDNVNVDKVSSACDAVTNKFSLLGTIGDQIIRDLTSKFTSAAEKMIKSFTVDQVASGWQKYADKTTAVQTIMANTIGEVGEGLKWKDQAEQMAAITEEIEKLNWFTDETSYSLTDMTNNIGKFVAQKVPLEQAVEAMMGISTWAAVSGQNKTQAQMAMYNLSQSLGAGSVKAIDWKSIENANMATAEFKETVIETAKELGVLDKVSGEIMEDYITATKYSGPDSVTVSNFRDTLSAGWFNSDVLMKSLEKYGGFSTKINELYNVVNRNGMVSTTSNLLKIINSVGEGSEEAAKQIELLAKKSDMATEDLMEMFTELNKPEYDLGKRAFAAAQEAKTFQEAIEATSDAVASEWMGIFEAIFGNYLEAKELWTDLANSLWDIFAAPLDNIKWSLIEWKDLEGLIWNDENKMYERMGGRQLLLESFSIAIENIAEAIEIVRLALAEVFPIFNLFVTEGEDAFDTSEAAKGIWEFTKGLHDFAESLKLSEDAANSLHTIVHVLATGIKIAFDVVGGFFEGIFKLVKPLLNIADAIFGVIGKIISAITGSKGVMDFSDKLADGAGKVKSTYLAVMDKVAEVLNKIADAIRGLPDLGIAEKIGEMFRNAKDGVVEFWEAFTNMPIIQQMVEDFNKTCESIDKKVTPILKKVREEFSKFKTNIKANFNWDTLNKGITVIYNKMKDFMTLIKNFATRIKEFFQGLKDGKSIVQSFKDSFGDIVDKVKELRDNLMNFFSDLFAKGDELGGKFDLASIQQAIHDFVANITPEQVTMIAVAGTFMLIALNLLRLSEALKNAVDAFTGIGVALKNVINSYVKKQKSTILQIAEAIVIVAASLWVLSTIPEADLTRALGAIMTLTGLLGSLTLVLTLCGIAMHKLGGEKSMVELASGLVFISGAFMMAALSLKVLEYVNLEGVLPKLAVLAGIMVGLSLLSILMGKIDKFGKGSLTMVAVAASMLIAATALAEIGQIPSESLDKSMDAMLKIMIGLAAVTLAAGKVGVFSAIGLIAIVLTIEKILPALEKIANYDYTGIEAGLNKNQDMLKRLGGVLLVMTAIGMLAGNRIKGAGIAMLALAGTFAIMLGIAKLAGQMRPEELKKGEDFLFKMGVIISMIELFSSKSRLQMFGGKNGGEGSKAFTRIAIAMGILLGIAKLASLMEWKDLAKGEVALAGLVGIIFLMTQVAKMSANSSGVIKSVSAMLFALSLILAEVALLSMIPMKSMLPALGTVLAIILSLAVLAKAISSGSTLGEGMKVNVGGIIAIITAIIGVFAIGVVLMNLAKLPMKDLATAAGSLTAVILAVSLLSAALGKIGGKFNWKMVQAAGEALIMVVALAAILGALTFFMQKFNLNGDVMMKAAAALTIGLVGIIPVLLVLNKFQGYTGKYEKIKKAVIGAIGLVAAVAVALIAMTRFGVDGNTMIQSAIALAIGLIAVCAPLAVIGGVGKLVQKTNIKSMATIIGGAIVALAAVATAITLISNLANPDTIMQSAIALGIALLAISVPIAVLGAVGALCATANPVVMGVAVGGAIAAVIAVAASLIFMANCITMEQANVLNSLIPVLVTCIGGVAVLAIALAVAGAAASVIPGSILNGFLAMVAAIGVFAIIVAAIIGLGALMDKFNGLRHALETGLDAMVLIFGKLGEAAGALLSGFGLGVTSNLDTIADRLNSFSEKMVIFADNMAKVSEDAVTGCRNMASAVLAITAASFIEGLTRWLGLGRIEDFDFKPLGDGVAQFCDAIKDIPGDALQKAEMASSIAKTLSEVVSGLEAKGGIIQFFTGEKDLTEFAVGVSTFGYAVKSFCESLVGTPQNAVELAQMAADTATPLVSLTKSLYGSGGILQAFTGEKDLSTFGNSLNQFGLYMKQFVSKLVQLEIISPDYVSVVQRCADATAPMIDLANCLENMGGILASVLGENTLDLFGQTLVPFGHSLKGLVETLMKIEEENADYPSTIFRCSVAVGYLVELANKLQNTGGILSGLTGDNDLGTFGQTLTEFGTALGTFVTEITGIDFSVVENAKESMTALVELGQMSGTVPMNAFLGLEQALYTIRDLPINSIATGLQENTATLITAVKDMFDLMVQTMNDRKGTDALKYNEYGKQVILSLKQGITQNTHLILTGLGAMILAITTYLDQNMKEDTYKTYGGYISSGLAQGISDGADAAVTAARDMVDAINKEIEKVEKIQSPSKVTYGYGMYIALGMANGIRDYTSETVDAASDMSEEIVTMANQIMSAIATAMDENVDAQPTIRPVLDTSDIAAKAKTIGRIFDENDLSLAYSTAGSIKATNDAKYSGYESENNGQNSSGAQINFTQNNYSPKALSRYEIYRDTKNQISMMKGVIANV